MKKAVLPLILVILCFAYFGFSRREKQIKRRTGVDLSGANLISEYDTHSGNGDGVSCSIYDTKDTDINRQIVQSGKWSPLPADDTVHTLLWGMSDESSKTGPYLFDENEQPLVKYADNGYYILIDRHSLSGNILERGSFNLTIALYDTDRQLLYYCKLDT